MNKFWSLAHWLSRVPLLAATAIFSLISWKYLTDPVSSTVPFGMSLGSPTAMTNVRVGFGAFPLGLAIVILATIVARRRLLIGLWIVVTLFAVVTAVRILGIVVDGATVHSIQVLRPEVALLVVSILCLFIERRRRQYEYRVLRDGGRSGMKQEE